MTLREQRSIVYPPNYNQVIDEYLLYAPKTHTVIIMLSAIWGIIYYGTKCMYYSIKEINKKFISELAKLFYN